MNAVAQTVARNAVRRLIKPEITSHNTQYRDVMAQIADNVVLPTPHARQNEFLESGAKRKNIRAGRRGGKTIGMSILAARAFLQSRRVLYAVPTQEQVDTFWTALKIAFAPAIEKQLVYKNETKHIIEIPNTKIRIRAKTAWNADTLRGDYADLLILDEFQLMNESAWEIVGAPMLLDNDGDAVFVFTPPSFRTQSITKAKDPLHANKLYKKMAKDNTGRSAVFHFTSHENPHISEKALADISLDMTPLAILQEIEAEDVDEVPGALWKRAEIDEHRVEVAPDLVRLVIAIDPSTTSGVRSNEAGIIAAGRDALKDIYILEDGSLRGTPTQWAAKAIEMYYRLQADCIVYETNQGGEMVETTLKAIDKNVTVKGVTATRGKYVRAEPIAVHYSKGRVHHVGILTDLEDQLCSWVPGNDSPDRLDADVWAVTDLRVDGTVRSDII